MPQLTSNTTVDSQTMVEGAITGNGRYHAFISPTISTNNNKAVDIDLTINSFLPNRDGLGKALCSMVMERLDDGDNWRPMHSMFSPVQAISYGPDENGGVIPSQQLSYGPNVFNFDGAVSIDSSDGVSIISQDHQKRGVMPSKFRVCVLVHERAFGQTGAFDSMTFSLDYELRAE